MPVGQGKSAVPGMQEKPRNRALLCLVSTLHAVAGQPVIPAVIGLDAVDQPCMAQLLARAVRYPAQLLAIGGRAHGKDEIMHDAIGMQPLPVAFAIAQVHVHDLGVEFGEIGRRIDPDIPFRMPAAEIRKSRRQPAHPKDGLTRIDRLCVSRWRMMAARTSRMDWKACEVVWNSRSPSMVSRRWRFSR